MRVRLTRREALAGGLAAAAGCAPKARDSAGDAEDTSAEPGSIDVVVVLMMENRSFDHVLGSLKLLEGHASDGLTADMSNPDADGVVHPVAPVQTECLFDPPHGWNSSHTQFDGGANDGFVREYQSDGAPDPGAVMGYYSRERLPITYAIADASCVTDRYFCSVMGPTWPNRFYAHAGTSNGQKDNSLPEEGGTFTFTTIWKKLDEAGVAWRYYYVDVPFLALFDDTLRDDTRGLLEDFVRDAELGRLPPVVWIDPGFGFDDDHPPHYPGFGQELIAVIYEALASSPQWKNVLFLITYDEHGGFFDHVAPPTTEDDFADDGFDQMGFRVPSLAVGPYVKVGVDSTVLDHASWIRYVCDQHGIEPWNKRIAAATSLGVVLDTDRLAIGDAAPPVELPPFDVDDETVPDDCFSGGLFGPPEPPEAHAELFRFVRERYPHLDRSARWAEFMGWVRARRR